MFSRSFFKLSAIAAFLAGSILADTDDCGPLIKRAVSLHSAGNRYSANVLFEQSYERCKDRSIPALYLGLMCTNADSAKLYFETALSSQDQSIVEEARYRLGQYFGARRDYKKSREFLGQVVEAGLSRSDEALGALANVCADDGDVAQAVVLFEKLHGRAELNGSARAIAAKGLGDCAVRRKMYSQSIPYYKEALCCADSATILNRLVFACAMSGEKELEAQYRSLLGASFPGSMFLDSLSGPSAKAPAEPVPPLARKSKPTYWLQIGVFGNHANAEQVQKETAGKIGPVDSVTVAVVRSRNLSIVRMGPFESEALASDFGKKTLDPLNVKFLVTLIR